jgi:hypothetical protein
MATNLAINAELINEAKRIGGHRTKKEAVSIALKEYIQHRKQKGIINLFGKIDYAEDYDYKEMRERA